MKEYGSSIRAERSRRRMTQEELATVAGLTRQTIVDLEAGRFEVSEATFVTLLNHIKEYQVQVSAKEVAA